MSQSPQLQQCNKTWRNLLAEGIKLPEYKLLLHRKYITPRGYQSVDHVAKLLASHILNAYQLPWELLQTDFAECNATSLSTQIAQAQAPFYWLSQSLLESFLHTDLPNWICGIKRPLHMGVLMLPTGVIYSPDGEAIDYIAFRHTLASEEPPAILINNQRVRTKTTNYDYVTSTTTTTTGTVYVSSIELKMTEQGELDRGESHFDTYELLGIEVDKDAEAKFLKTIDSIVLQTLLVMQIRPEIASCSQLQPATKLGFGKTSKDASALWSPNWIGKGYTALKQIQSSAICASLRQRQGRTQQRFAIASGTHASPRSHWRRGHFRRVAVGSRNDNQRSWRWFEPVHVNFNATR